MKYLKLFKTESDRDAFLGGGGLILPNVSVVEGKKDVIYKPKKIINFIINGYRTIPTTAYRAEEGMTWEQWVNSSYNTGNYFCSDGGICPPLTQGLLAQPMVFTLSGVWVGQDEVITNNTTYELSD